MVRVLRSIAGLRDDLTPLRRDGKSIGLVPTMGALHAGHGSLIERSARENDYTVVSIFVNPAQFDRQDDYAAYPRDFEKDVEYCRSHGAGWIFAPAVDEMYPGTGVTFVEAAALGRHLCGPFRPGHFCGVATVVAKLLNIVEPNRAYFGEKDYQQLAIIRRMVADLNLPAEIAGVGTVREADGLALSSRNQLLSPEERRVAPVLYEALRVAQNMIRAGETCPGEVIKQTLPVMTRESLVRVEYLEIVDPEDLQPVDEITRPVLAAAAVRIGAIRLIDNIVAGPGEAA